MPDDRISVVIPTYNSSKFIIKTLNTVTNQEILPDEVLVIDDGSSDNTIEIINQYIEKNHYDFIRVIKQKNKGPGAARNMGIRSSKYEWIAFLDSDDLWDKEKIKLVKEIIRKEKNISIITHDEYEISENGKQIYKALHKYYDESKPLFPQLFSGCFLSTSCMVVSKKLLIEVKGFDVTLPSAQDYDLWLRISQKGNLKFICKPLETYIIRENSISSNLGKRRNCLKRIYLKHVTALKKYNNIFTSFLLITKVVLKNYFVLIRDELRKLEYLEVIKLIMELPFYYLKIIFHM